MSDLIRLGLIFFVILNPAGFSIIYLDLTTAKADRQRLLISGAALSALLLVVAALCADPLLDALDISMPSFQIATGALLAISALPVFLGEERYSGAPVERSGWVIARFVLWLASPAALAAAMAYGVDRGVGWTIAAVLIALAMSVGVAAVAPARLATGSQRALAVWMSRGLAAVLIVIAVDLIRQGVENV